MIAPLALVLPFALAAEGWTEDEAAALAAARARLPASVLPAGAVLDLRRDPAAHPGARVRDGRVVVTVGAGPDPGADLVHALVHLADEQNGWSATEGWRSLSDWRRVLGVWWTPERSPRAFAAPRGMGSPAEDLATVAEAAWAPTAPARDAPLACDAPSKWAALHALAGVAALTPPCRAGAAAALRPEAVESVELVFVAPTAASPASIAGHLLIAVHFRPDDRGIARHTSFGLVADTTGVKEGSPRYIASGFSGAFPSRIRREPFVATALRYGEHEGRDVRRYRLRLDEDQLARVVRRLGELERSWDRPYLITSRNCAALVIELTDAAWGERPPDAISPDVLTAWMERRGWLVPVAPDRPEELGVGQRAAVAAEARRRELAALSEAAPGLHGVGRALDSRRAERRAQGYAALRSLLLVAPEQAPRVARIVAWSDPIELEAARHGDGERPSPAQVAHRALATEVRRHQGVGWAEGVRAAEVEAARARWSAPGTAHTPFRAMRVGLAAQGTRGGGPSSAWLTLSTPFYAGQMGASPREAAPRRYRQAPGLGLQLLDGELRLPIVAAGPMQARFRLAAVQNVDRLRAPRRLGFGVSVLDVWTRRDGAQRTRSEWARAEALVAVAAAPDMGNHLLLAAGGTATSWRWRAPSDAEGVRGWLGLPAGGAADLPAQSWTGVGASFGFDAQLVHIGAFAPGRIRVSHRSVRGWAPAIGPWVRTQTEAVVGAPLPERPGRPRVLLEGVFTAWDDPQAAAAFAPGVPEWMDLQARVVLERW